MSTPRSFTHTRSLPFSFFIASAVVACAVGSAEKHAAQRDTSGATSTDGTGADGGATSAQAMDASMGGTKDPRGGEQTDMAPDAGDAAKDARTDDVSASDAAEGHDNPHDAAMSMPIADAAPVCTPTDCSDAIGCTVDRCGSDGQCTHDPDDARCNGGEHCVVGRGCAPICDVSPCKLVSPQCGCVSGQGCYPDGTGAPGCATAGTKSEGQSCSTLTDCKPGLLCVNDSSNAAKPAPVCKRLCGADSDCSGEGSLCVTKIVDANGKDTGVTTCSRACDPVAQFGCPSGTACNIFIEPDGKKRVYTDCDAPVGTGTQLSTCSSAKPCAAGYGCLDFGSGSRCYEFCEGDNDCDGLDLCEQVSPALVVGSARYGVCQ